MNPVLTIDPEFEAKCPPLTDDELSQLEENILEEGLVLMPLIVWNDTIVDGHNRYRIAQAHPGIGFRTHEKNFNSKYEALSWICKNQLGRRNLTPQQKKYLIGQRYDAEKKTHGGDRKSNLPESSGQNDHLIAAQKTRERIASETGTSESYVLHPTIRNKLAIDPEAAEVVRKIFLLAIDGNTPTEIAIRLNDEGIPTPGQYFIERHPDTKKYRRSCNKLNWSHAMVYRTLTKLVYIGCAVGHERRTKAHPRYAPPQSVAGHDRAVAPSAAARLHPLPGESVPCHA